MIQCGRVERIAEPNVDYKSIPPDWDLLGARRAPIIYILIHHGTIQWKEAPFRDVFRVCIECI
jgi:hypothetical protein